MEAKHTPTPWRVAFCGEGSDCWCRLVVSDVEDAEDDKTIITFGSLRAHNADFIVRACNSHDALMEALKLCAGVLTGADMSKSCLVDALEKARVALALAGEAP